MRPAPRDEFGPYAKFNSDVVDSILICAVRSAYENLIKELEHSFEVEVVDAFDFVTRDESDETDELIRSAVHRVVSWSLEDAADLAARRKREAAAAQETHDRAELGNLAATFGFATDAFVAALVRAGSKKATGPAPSVEAINRDAAKDLRNAGFKIDAGGVRRIRKLIERYSPDLLPAELKPGPSDPPTPRS